MLNIGLTPEKLLAELEDYFPPFNPYPGMTTDHLFFKAGQRDVVEWVHQRIQRELEEDV